MKVVSEGYLALLGFILLAIEILQMVFPEVSSVVSLILWIAVWLIFIFAFVDYKKSDNTTEEF